MSHSRLTLDQARQLREQIRIRLVWLNRVCGRMRGWDPDDTLYLHARRARDVMQDFMTVAHYAGVEHGVGEPTDGPVDFPETK